MSETILATYRDMDTAQRVVKELRDAGFSRGDIGLAARDEHGEYSQYAGEDVTAEEGTGFGAIVGMLTGAAAGLVAITIPGIGPIIAAGPLAALGGAAAGAGIGAVAGAATGGITASLVDLGVDEQDAHYYAESMRHGDVLVAATARDQDVDRATQIMQRHHPVDMDRRMTQWRQSGWKGFDPMTDSYTAPERTEDYDYTAEDYEYTSPPVRRYPRRDVD